MFTVKNTRINTVSEQYLNTSKKQIEYLSSNLNLENNILDNRFMYV